LNRIVYAIYEIYALSFVKTNLFTYLYDTTLESLYPLQKNRKLFYLFDYGDSWLFKISKSRKKPHDPEKRKKYPRIIEVKGKTPKQYPVEWD